VTYRGMDSIMRRMVVLEHITLDGVIQAGGRVAQAFDLLLKS
jgi:hypothetical protein